MAPPNHSCLPRLQLHFAIRNQRSREVERGWLGGGGSSIKQSGRVDYTYYLSVPRLKFAFKFRC